MEPLLSKEILSKVRQIEIRTNRLVNDSIAGNYHSVFKGSGMNFEEVREYVPGDDIRTIDWNVTARTGSPHIKKYTEERDLTLVLMIDISGSGDFGSVAGSKREMMAEIGAVLAFSAIKNCDKVGLILFTDFIEQYIPPKKGRSHILRLIREILYFKPQRRQTDLKIPLDFINKILKRKAVAFLISDFSISGDFTNGITALKPKLQITNRHHDLIAVSVTDPKEFSLPDIGWLTLEDAETGEQIEVNTSDPDTRQQYSDLASKQQLDLHKVIQLAGIDFLDLSTGSSYLSPLLQFFGVRKGRM